MKYMGSKRAMLQNGLGDLVSSEILHARRFVDLFTGSGAVAVHVARSFTLPVHAFDLQSYSIALAGAVLHRDRCIETHAIWDTWLKRAEEVASQTKPPKETKLTQKVVAEYRRWCACQTLPITRAYGGHYFSPEQSVWVDALRATLPTIEPARTVALAALVRAASQCVAAPGHTAQPFQPTRTAKPFLAEAWKRSITERTENVLTSYSDQFALSRGRAELADANVAAATLEEGDLAFIDPPYSGVQYSRFYHVLETVAQGTCGDVSGVGRYPASSLRPRSEYSLASKAKGALNDLLKTVASRGARAILTFPDHDCSNGLSGQAVRELAGKYFVIVEQHVKSSFSSLGGTGNKPTNLTGRAARRDANELMLVLSPKVMSPKRQSSISNGFQLTAGAS